MKVFPYFERYGKNASSLLALLAVSITLNIGFGVIIPFIPTFGLKIGATAVEIGYIISGFMVGRMISAPNAGALSDIIGRRKVMLFGTLLYAFVTFAMAFSNNWVMFLLFRIIEGMAVGAVWPTAQAHLIDIVPKERVGEATGLYAASFSLGFFVGPLLGSGAYYFSIYLGHDKDFAIVSPFFTTGILGLLAFIGLFLFVHNVPEFAQQARSLSKMNKEERDAELATSYGIYGKHFNYSLEYKKFYSISLINGIGVGIIIPIFVIYFVDKLGYDEGMIGVVIGVGGAISMFLNPLGGVLADKIGRKPVMYAGLILMATGTFLLGFVTSLIFASILFWMRMSGFGFFFPGLRSQQADAIRPVERGKIFGRIQLMFNTGGLVGPILGTWLYQHYENEQLRFLDTPFQGGAVPFAVTGLILFSMLILVRTLHAPRVDHDIN